MDKRVAFINYSLMPTRVLVDNGKRGGYERMCGYSGGEYRYTVSRLGYI